MAEPTALSDAPKLPEHVTWPLLEVVRRQALDDEYSQVARTSGRQRSGSSAALGAVLMAAVVGLLGVTAFVQNIRDAGVQQASRETLIRQITERSETVARARQSVARLQAGNALLDDRLGTLRDRQTEAEARTRRLRTRTGFGAVAGPGVRWVVDDPVNPGPGDTVRDEDLAILVDGLWRAGAEGISINGQRLTVLSAIRISGGAIYVNRWPLAPPYVVSAVGNPETLSARFLDNAHGLAWFDLVDRLGFRFEMHNEDRLTLPSAPERQLRLRYAVVAAGGPEPVVPTPGGAP